MSNQTPPPKPKPGSLRDRIAAFENKPASSPAERPVPAPRPKPGGLAWKPRVPSPSPSSPPNTAGSSPERAHVPGGRLMGGMSASDAKESIGLGGSLKDRMAALQGRGAFGGISGGAPGPPKPAVEKPKWKPPPAVSSPPDESDGETLTSDAHSSLKSPPPVTQQSTEDESHHTETGDEPISAPDAGEEAEQFDPEEEERQRRAAIAARMARLGGARVGMAPPIFGRKPSIKRTETAKDGEAPSTESKPVVFEDDRTSLKSPPIEETPEVTSKPETETSTDYFAGAPSRKNSASSSVLSADSISQPSKSPLSMPVPSVPRRAAPPRKKPAKSHSSSQGVSIVSESQEDSPEPLMNAKSDTAGPQPEAERQHGVEEAEKEQVENTHEATKSPFLSEGHYVTESPGQIEGSGDAEKGDHGTREPEIYIGEPTEEQKASRDASPSENSVELAPTETDEVEAHATFSEPPVEMEEEEAERRKRVAEKMAKMGGFNPFAPRQSAIPLPTDNESETNDDTSSEVVEQPAESSTSADEAFPNERDDFATMPTHSTDESTSSHTKSPALEPSPDSDNVKPGSIPESVFREDHEDDLSQSTFHRAFNASGEHDLKGDSFEDEIHGRYENDESPEGQLGRSYETIDESITHTYIDGEQPRDFSEEENENERASSRMYRPIPLPPVPNMSSRPDVAHQRSASQGSTRRPLPQPPQAVPAAPILEAGSRPQEYGTTPRPSYRPIPPVPISVDDELSAIEETGHLRETEPLQEQAPPPPPRRLPPPPRRQSGDPGTQTPASASLMSQPQGYGSIAPIPPPSRLRTDRPFSSPAPTPPVRPVPPPLSLDDEREREILDEDEGDPIDPSLQRYSTIPPSLPNLASSEVSNLHPLSSLEPQVLPHTRSLSPSGSTSSPPSSPSISPPLQSSFSEDSVVQDSSEYEYRPHPSNHDRLSYKASETVLDSETETETPIFESDSEEQEDPEQARRRTIAERMAKLGDIRFGAPPTGRASTNAAEDVFSRQPGALPEEEDLETVQLAEEDEERARKQRIASKLAGMGGIGMFGAPQRAPMQPPTRRRGSGEIIEKCSSPPPPPPQREIRPRAVPPPQQQDLNIVPENHYAFEDSAKAEAEGDDNKVEEVNPIEEETPPPVPFRGGRRVPGTRPMGTVTSSPPRRTALSPRRPPIPPVPSNVANRRSSLRKSSADYTPPGSRMSSFDISRSSPTPQMEYVMVEDPELLVAEETPFRTRPALMPNNDGNASGWEIPSVPPSMNFDGPQLDLSLSSWSDDSTPYPTPQAPPRPSLIEQETRRPSTQSLPKPGAEVQLSSDELMAAWGRIGVQLCEVATTMFDKSKKSHIGDGSYRSFVLAVFSQVPNAKPPSEAGYGYLIYAQTGSVAQRRVCDIMPGDIVTLFDAKLKGHKGLQIYHQHVGATEPLVGIISEFESKKSKIKVFHANQHVGQQTVESVSYRLEDLKSGAVKIFRALEV